MEGWRKGRDKGGNRGRDGKNEDMGVKEEKEESKWNAGRGSKEGRGSVKRRKEKIWGNEEMKKERVKGKKNGGRRKEKGLKGEVRD